MIGFRVRRAAFACLTFDQAVTVTFVLHRSPPPVAILDEIAFLEIDDDENQTGRERRGEVVRVEAHILGRTVISVDCPGVLQ